MYPFLQVFCGDLSNDKLMGIYYVCTCSRSQAVLDHGKLGYCAKCSRWRQVSSRALQGEGCRICDCKAGCVGRVREGCEKNGS